MAAKLGMRDGVIEAVRRVSGAPCDGKKPVELTDGEVTEVRDHVVDAIVKGRIDWPKTKDKSGALRDVPTDELPSRVRKIIHEALNRASSLNGGKTDDRSKEPKRILNDPQLDAMRELLKQIEPTDWRAKRDIEREIRKRQTDILRLSKESLKQFMKEFGELVERYVDRQKS